jgi:type VI secretion system protein ImpE
MVGPNGGRSLEREVQEVMVDPTEAIRNGALAEAVAEIEAAVRKAPADPKHRHALFQLLLVLSQWERALDQLTVLAELDAVAAANVLTYRSAIQCEAFRRDVFAGRRTPLIFGQPEPWMAHLVEAARLLAQGDSAAAYELRKTALEQAPPSQGTIYCAADEEDGHAFQWIADADGRLGPMLETVMNGAYYWVPFERVKSLRLDAPTDLSDSVWMMAHFTWANEGEAPAMVPTRYAGTEDSSDNLLHLSRKTEWLDQGNGMTVGVGQRLLATDVDDYPLMDVRRIEIA